MPGCRSGLDDFFVDHYWSVVSHSYIYDIDSTVEDTR